MTKLFFALALLLASAAYAVTPQAYAPGTLAASCSAVTTTGACIPLYLPGNSLAVGVTWQISYDTGTAVSASVTLQGSNDNSTWTVLDTNTGCLTTGGSACSRSITVTSYKYLACNVGTYSVGTTDNLSCSLTANPNGSLSGSGGLVPSNGGLVVYHTGGANPTIYSAGTNTNTARGTALLAAGAAAVNGDTIVAACGATYDTGSTPPAQWFKNSTNLAFVTSPACAPLSTQVTYAHFGLTDADVGVDLCGSTNAYIQGIYFNDTAQGLDTPVIGTISDATHCSITNFTLKDVGCSGDTDCFFVTAQSITGHIIHSSFNSLWDTNRIGTCSGHVWIEQGSSFITTGNSPESSGGVLGQSRPIQVAPVGLGCGTSTLVVDVVDSSGDASSTEATGANLVLDFQATSGATINVRGGNWTAECNGGSCSTTPLLALVPSGAAGNFHVTGPIVANPTTIAGDPNADGSSNYITPQVVYAKPATGVSMSTSANTIITNSGAATTMITPGSPGTYELSVDITPTAAGSGGTCTTGGVGVSIGYKDADTGVAIVVGTGSGTFENILYRSLTASGATISQTVTYVATPSPGNPSAIFNSVPQHIHAAAGTAIQYQVWQSTASNCTTPPVLTIKPILKLVAD